ncbi:Peptidyl-prolyl cis-trans isomerase CYP19-1 [Cardamine amara subsp. amara]|uniref:Peptidyl-prolyl cis-trans isomerase n=1 Tax=Cardamine amara subsp. amara TaxID=228776 RepID=A0ABD0ZRX7_CARAN
MEISFSANGPITFHVPAGSGGFTINVNPVGGLVPPAVGNGGRLNVNRAHIHPPASGSGGVKQVCGESVKAAETPKPSDPSLKIPNPKVFFDMTVDGKPVGRIVMELFADTTPRTAENFRALCTGEKGIGKLGKPLHYKGSIFHRIDPAFLYCGGDITAGNGTGQGESIYGGFFEDENFIRKLNGPGTILMYGANKDSNGSKFMISMAEKNNWEYDIDIEHVVFGQVVEGLDVLRNIGKVATPDCMPSKPVVIADCGQIL